MVKIYTKSCRSTTRQRATAQAAAHTAQAARRATCDRSSSPIATKLLQTLKRPNAALKLLLYPSTTNHRSNYTYILYKISLSLAKNNTTTSLIIFIPLFFSLFFVRPLFNLIHYHRKYNLIFFIF